MNVGTNFAISFLCVTFGLGACFEIAEQSSKVVTGDQWKQSEQLAREFAEVEAFDKFYGCVRAERVVQCSGEKKQRDFPGPELFAFECDAGGCRRTAW